MSSNISWFFSRITLKIDWFRDTVNVFSAINSRFFQGILPIFFYYIFLVVSSIYILGHYSWHFFWDPDINVLSTLPRILSKDFSEIYLRKILKLILVFPLFFKIFKFLEDRSILSNNASKIVSRDFLNELSGVP